MSHIKNVAIAGANGDLGSAVLKQLVASKKFNITVLTRTGSHVAESSSYKVVEVDYDSNDSLAAAVTGQDAIVSTLGTLAVAAQIPLINAAAAAGVKHFIPSDFGGDFDNAKTRAIPVFSPKVDVQEQLQAKAAESDMAYTFIYCGGLLDWGLEHDFLLQMSNYKPILVNGGNAEFSVSFLRTVGDSVVGVLTHPEEAKNRTVYVHDAVVSQTKLLEIAKSVAPEKPWSSEVVDLDAMVADSEKRMAAGEVHMGVVMPFVFRVIMDPPYGGKFEKVDNELLGVGFASEDDIVEAVRKAIN